MLVERVQPLRGFRSSTDESILGYRQVKHPSDGTAAIARQLVREEGTGSESNSTSGAFGLTSPDGVISSACDLSLAAFSTSNAAKLGFPVARAKLRSAIA